jgi:tripartite-type tricarboxylate transporter receptor subunit TctC
MAQESFFAGREVRIIVGTGAGGGYDTYGRLVARFLGSHIPGNPTFVVQSMPGASGIKAVNYLYSVAPKDGSVFSIFNNSMPVYQAIGQPGVQFKCEELSWLAAMSKLVNVVAVWHTTGAKTIEDAKKKEIVIGATGASGTMAGYPALLNNTIGTKFKIVTGYEGGNQINLAMERGEIQGRGTLSWSSVQSLKPDWYADKKIIPLVQVGPKKEPDLPHVPLLTELAQDDVQRQMFQFVTAPTTLERPFAGPPNVPADRLSLLRRGFEAMAKDREFLDAAKKQDIEIDLTPGEEVQKVVAAIVATPPDIIEKTRIAMTVKDSAK